MRICFVNDCFLKDPTATITGPMVQTYLLAQGLVKRGWEARYVATTRGERAGTVETHEGIEVHYVRAARRFELSSARAVERVLRAIPADVYYQRGRSPLTGITARVARQHQAKFVWASSGESGVRRRKYLGQQLAKKRGVKRLIFTPLYWWSDRLYERGIESADVVIVQTGFQRDELRREFGRDSVVMKSGHPVLPASVLEKPAPPVVLWIGAVKPAKQPELFLKLVERCASSNARFQLVGRVEDEQWKSRLASFATRYPVFTSRGEVPFHQVSPVFAGASLLINTTIPEYEGLPNAFIQAWLHGVPVVSLHADPDHALERERIGFRADTFDKLAERVTFLLNHPTEREAMGRRARQFAEREFGMEHILSQFEEILSKTGSPRAARI